MLDRDGTLIDFVRDAEIGAVVTAFHPSQIRLLPGVIEGLRMLAESGFTLAIATNQPGAAKGQIPREAIFRTNEALVSMLRVEGITIAKVAVCLHHPEGGPGGDASLVGACDCRKPKAGMPRSICEELALDARASWMIGDTLGDVEAGAAAGMRTALLAELGRCELCPLKGEAAPTGPDLVAARLDAIARRVVMTAS
ncbi:MAG: HAD-IIIA family hydrolase [Polyangiaceae bacterium]